MSDAEIALSHENASLHLRLRSEQEWADFLLKRKDTLRGLLVEIALALCNSQHPDVLPADLAAKLWKEVGDLIR